MLLTSFIWIKWFLEEGFTRFGVGYNIVLELMVDGIAVGICANYRKLIKYKI